MMISETLIVNLLIILSAAWLLGYIFSRFGLPVMLGELMAGLILGPALLDVVHSSEQIELLADLGIFFVMFYAGMEMDPRLLLAHIRPALATALGGFVLPFVMGYFTTRVFGGTVFQALFVGMGLSVTAIAVQAVILQNLRIHHSNIGHIIMGAAIADDIFSLVTLGVLLGLAKSGVVEPVAILMLLGKVVLFFGFTIVVGEFVMPRLTPHLTDSGGKAFTFAMIVALVMAFLAEKAGLHLVIGAFLAGQFVRREIMDQRIYELLNDRFYSISYGFLTPIFFATLGFQLAFTWTGEFIALACALTAVAILGKVLGCGLGAKLTGQDTTEALVVGIGMNGRGAVELVIASVVIQLSDQLLASGVIREPLLTPNQFSALVFMAFVTTIMTPIILKWLVVRSCSSADGAAFCALWDQGDSEEFRAEKGME
ncbi:MAG: cation:proton antiporter [Proteobacteria bacterium]|nr:cation:proton antiporter [Pseudomonadota bacterium]MBU1688258.1 cation:proton antiporter [Pseudomonadota bacterium]